jgi:hypothetical protein
VALALLATTVRMTASTAMVASRVNQWLRVGSLWFALSAFLKSRWITEEVVLGSVMVECATVAFLERNVGLYISATTSSQ